MPYIQIANGLNIFYRGVGSGSRLVLFIHGNAASSLWWDRVMTAFPPGVLAVAPDLRCCGNSDKPAGSWSMADLAEDMYQFTRARGFDRYTVVGHSLGGGVALHLAVAHPEAVEGLVLVNSAPAEGVAIPEERFPQLQAVAQTPEMLKAALAASMPTAPRDEFYDALLADSVAKSAGAFVRNSRAVACMNLAEEAGGLRMPVLLLLGLQDALITLKMMERTRDLIPGAVLETWADVGHSAPVEAPERLAGRIYHFLESQALK